MSADDSDVKTFTSQKLDWMFGIAIDPDLKSHDFEVGSVIAMHLSMTKRTAVIADETIGRYTRTTRWHVMRSRKRLKDAGWLSWQSTRTANVYILLYERVDAMLDLRAQYRDDRHEARSARLQSRRDVVPVSQQDIGAVTLESQHEVIPVAQHVVIQESHIHPNCSTFEDSPLKSPAFERRLLKEEEEDAFHIPAFLRRGAAA
jgi:hypothetical protein